MGLVGPLSQISPVEQSINHVILLIGLAVGVDYALFYLRRAREERAAGRSADAALEAAAATSGRAVLVSGITVMTAMAGMYLAGSPTFTSFATGTITVVAVAMLGSLTVLPALMSKLGDRVDKGRVPGLARVKGRMARDRHLVADRRPRPAPPGAVGRPVGRAAGRHGDPGRRPGHRHPAHGRLAAQGRAGRADVQPGPGRVPGGEQRYLRGGQGRGRHVPRRSGRHREARAEGCPGQEHVPGRGRRGRRQPGQDGRDARVRDRRRRHRRAVQPGARRDARRARPRDARPGRRRADVRRRRDRAGPRLQRHDEGEPAAASSGS